MTSKIQDLKNLFATCEVHDLKNVVSGWYGAAPSDDPPTNFLPRSLVRKDVVNKPARRKTPGCRRLKIDAFKPVGRLQRPRREPDDEAAGAPRGARKAEVGQYGRLEFELEAVEPQPRGP